MSEIVQQTLEWHELRKKSIGASDACVIMHVSPWKTPFQLWKEKVGFGESKSNDSMRRGLDLEPKAREVFKNKTGIEFTPTVMIHPEIKWMIASLDGFSLSKKAVLEIKCVNRIDHAEAVSGKIPEKYFPQIQHQLEVTGCNHGYYFSFDGEDGAIVEFGRDSSYIKQLIDEETVFYNCMQQLLAPDLTERDYEKPQDPASWKKATDELKALQPYLQMYQPYFDKEKVLRELIQSMAMGKNVMDYGCKVTQVTRKGSIDYSKIPELKQIEMEKYRKSSVTYAKITMES